MLICISYIYFSNIWTMLKRYLQTTIDASRAHLGILLLRLMAGGFMLAHGYPKLMKLLSGDMKFADPLGLGSGLSLGLTVFSEFFCALMIIIGLGTRLFSLPLAFTMLIAAFVIHGADPFGKKELALIYMGMYLILYLLGSGKYSVDHMLSKDKV